VKFPIGGIRAMLLSPRAFLGRIWCDSKADSIVWMGEDRGSAGVQKFLFYERLLSVPLYTPSSKHTWGIYYYIGI